jgi:hypothetical protein
MYGGVSDESDKTQNLLEQFSNYEISVLTVTSQSVMTECLRGRAE